MFDIYEELNLKIHHFTKINIALCLMDEIEIIFNNDIKPITIIHCYENLNSDRSYYKLGFPSEYKDINNIELLAVVPLAIIVLFLGVYPQPLLDIISHSIDTIIGYITPVG